LNNDKDAKKDPEQTTAMIAAPANLRIMLLCHAMRQYGSLRPTPGRGIRDGHRSKHMQNFMQYDSTRPRTTVGQKQKEHMR